MAVDRDAELVARRHHARVLARSPGESLSQRAATAPAMLSAFTLRHAGAELLEGSSDVAGDARLDRLLQCGLALAHDLVHHCGPHARLLQLREGLAGVHGVELLLVADQHHFGNAQGAGDPEQVAGLDGRRERALVHHQHRLREGAAHAMRGLACQSALGDACVAREKTLQGLALDAGLGCQRLHGRRRGCEACHAVAALFRERARPVQHGGLAGAGVALDAHDPVLR